MGEARRRLRAVRQAMLRRRGGAVGQLRIVDKTRLAGVSAVGPTSSATRTVLDSSWAVTTISTLQ